MTWTSIALAVAAFVAVVVLVGLPPRLDPAVRLKQWLDGLRERDRRYGLPDDPPEQGEEFFNRAKIHRLRPRLQDDRGIPVEETPGGKLWLEIMKDKCPHCGTSPARFIEGPSGGLSTNIQCEICGWWYNVTPTVGIAEDLGRKGDLQ